MLKISEDFWKKFVMQIPVGGNDLIFLNVDFSEDGRLVVSIDPNPDDDSSKDFAVIQSLYDRLQESDCFFEVIEKEDTEKRIITGLRIYLNTVCREKEVEVPY